VKISLEDKKHPFPPLSLETTGKLMLLKKEAANITIEAHVKLLSLEN
jgi:hypothetical protein